MPSSDSPNLPNDDFEQSLRQVEDSLVRLKERYHQIQSHQAEQPSLLEQQQVLRDRYAAEPSVELKQQLTAIADQLQELEIALESSLLSDRQSKQLMGELLRNGILGELFWQIVRFGGMGIILGWLLKSWAG
jgi:hypothetical protein